MQQLQRLALLYHLPIAPLPSSLWTEQSPCYYLQWMLRSSVVPPLKKKRPALRAGLGRGDGTTGVPTEADELRGLLPAGCSLQKLAQIHRILRQIG